MWTGWAKREVRRPSRPLQVELPASRPQAAPRRAGPATGRRGARVRAALFPGQGIRPGEILEALPPDDPFLEVAGELLGYDLRSRVEFGARGRESTLPTSIAQPALFCAGVAAWRGVEERGETFDYLAGHSVGEYAALVAAAALSREDGLRVVKARAEGMHAAGRATSGAMAAILKLDLETVAAIAEKAGVVVANDNAPGQVVLAGREEALAEASAEARAAGGRALLLEVAGAFHSPAMAEAARALKSELGRVPIQSPRVPVVSNLSARPYRDAAEIRELLVRQVTERVRFRESLEWLYRQGVREFQDLGPGRVVAGLAEKTFAELQRAEVAARA